MATAVHLWTNNSKTKVVSSLKKDHLGEGVSTLNVAGKIEFLTPLCSMLQFDKVRETKMVKNGVSPKRSTLTKSTPTKATPIRSTSHEINCIIIGVDKLRDIL
jgi:hypothetical protein